VGCKPWSIPSTANLDHMESFLLHSEDTQDFMEADRRHWVSWTFSACAVAIDASTRLPTETLKNIPSIVLHKTSSAVQGPKCHSQGLLPLIKQNPMVRLERRVKGYEAAHLSYLGSGEHISNLETRRFQPKLSFNSGSCGWKRRVPCLQRICLPKLTLWFSRMLAT
jgi:hypothetical protein